MERFFVEGGNRLHGEVKVSGAMHAVLEGLGARSEFAGNTLSIDSWGVDSYTAPYDLVRQMRASIVVLGPLVARFGEAEVSAPGGCNLGLRKFNFHLDGLRALGAEVGLDHGFIKAEAPRGLRGAEVIFEYPSVTATENVMMAAVLARGTTII